MQDIGEQSRLIQHIDVIDRASNTKICVICSQVLRCQCFKHDHGDPVITTCELNLPCNPDKFSIPTACNQGSKTCLESHTLGLIEEMNQCLQLSGNEGASCRTNISLIPSTNFSNHFSVVLCRIHRKSSIKLTKHSYANICMVVVHVCKGHNPLLFMFYGEILVTILQKLA